MNDQPPAATADDALFMLWQLLIAASQGFSIRDVGWHNWGLRRNVDFRRNFHDFVILDASAWNCRPPQDPQWTQISTGRASSSPIRASCRFWQARTWHKGSGACYNNTIAESSLPSLRSSSFFNILFCKKRQKRCGLSTHGLSRGPDF